MYAVLGVELVDVELGAGGGAGRDDAERDGDGALLFCARDGETAKMRLCDAPYLIRFVLLLFSPLRLHARAQVSDGVYEELLVRRGGQLLRPLLQQLPRHASSAVAARPPTRATLPPPARGAQL